MRYFVVLIVLLVSSQTAWAKPPRWEVDENRSSLAFIFMQEGGTYRGTFERFTSDILFDPQDLKASHAKVVIDLTSLNAGNEERNDALRSSDWFYLKKFPTAEFKTTSFQHLADNRYDVSGVLSIRGIEQQVVLASIIEIEGDSVHMTAEMDMNRLDYGLGEGFWANPDFIGLEVALDIELFAQHQP
ncbi:MAG: YceI family protein [Sphingomonadales bacterium]|jgi:polyisoprenoid-binding protein YceI